VEWPWVNATACRGQGNAAASRFLNYRIRSTLCANCLLVTNPIPHPGKDQINHREPLFSLNARNCHLLAVKWACALLRYRAYYCNYQLRLYLLTYSGQYNDVFKNCFVKFTRASVVEGGKILISRVGYPRSQVEMLVRAHAGSSQAAMLIADPSLFRYLSPSNSVG